MLLAWRRPEAALPACRQRTQHALLRVSKVLGGALPLTTSMNNVMSDLRKLRGANRPNTNFDERAKHAGYRTAAHDNCPVQLPHPVRLPLSGLTSFRQCVSASSHMRPACLRRTWSASTAAPFPPVATQCAKPSTSAKQPLPVHLTTDAQQMHRRNLHTCGFACSSACTDAHQPDLELA